MPRSVLSLYTLGTHKEHSIYITHTYTSSAAHKKGSAGNAWLENLWLIEMPIQLINAEEINTHTDKDAHALHHTTSCCAAFSGCGRNDVWINENEMVVASGFMSGAKKKR